MSLKAFLGDLIVRLASRKLWLTVLSSAYLATHGDPTQAVSVVIAYLGLSSYITANGQK